MVVTATKTYSCIGTPLSSHTIAMCRTGRSMPGADDRLDKSRSPSFGNGRPLTASQKPPVWAAGRGGRGTAILDVMGLTIDSDRMSRANWRAGRWRTLMDWSLPDIDLRVVYPTAGWQAPRRRHSPASSKRNSHRLVRRVGFTVTVWRSQVSAYITLRRAFRHDRLPKSHRLFLSKAQLRSQVVASNAGRKLWPHAT